MRVNRRPRRELLVEVDRGPPRADSRRPDHPARHNGLIERKPEAADGRSSLINLTSAAVAKAPDVLAVLDQGRDEMLAGRDDAERERLVELLLRVLANLEAAVRRLDDAAVPSARPKP